jgi:predicted PurR-regulated permease PerM
VKAEDRKSVSADGIPVEVAGLGGERAGSLTGMDRPGYGESARRVFVITLVVGSVVVGGLVLWKLRLLIALLFIAMTIAAAMRPGVDALARRRVPRSIGVAIHYLAFLGLLALFLSFVVPDLLTQVTAAIDSAQRHQTETGSGVKERLLRSLDTYLRHLPRASQLIHPALALGRQAVAILVGIFFVFAAAAYWLFERDRAIDLVTSFIPRLRRKKVRDTWELIDLKLGAFMRGQILMIACVSTVVSIAFWLVGEPYWLLLGVAVGLVEIIPVVGPLLGLLLAVGVGLTVNWQTAASAAAVLLAIRLFQDYVVNPRVMGNVVGLSPLVVMVSAIAVATLFGPFYVLLSVPIASLVVTVVDVAARGVDPAEAEVPTVLFSADDAEP